MQHLNLQINPKILNAFLCILLLTTLPLSDVFALPEDQSQTLELSADTADLDQQTRRGEYTGEVILDQGTTHLRAAKAVTITDKENKLIEAIAYGNSALPDDNPAKLVHYWTQPAIDKPVVHAYADTLHYYPNEHRIELLGHAHVEQGNDSLTATNIFYDTVQQHVIAKSDGITRTVIVFTPEKKA